MHERLSATLESADATLAGAVGFVEPESLERASRLVARARNRMAYPEDLSVVALAGGTGSGKSSLFNRILDSDIAEVGGIRPTTTVPLASTPEVRRDVIDSYVASLGDLKRISHRGLPWLTLIDLPDTDSVETDHRLRAEALLGKVDVVVWVTDVEKYRDDALHRGLIRPLRDYQGQFLFVLNQIDRIPKAEVGDIAQDFETALIDDGIGRPKIVATAADPPLTPPYNIDELRTALQVVAEGSALGKVLNDLEAAIAALGQAGAGSGLDFEERWRAVREEAVGAMARGDVIGPSRRLASFFATLAEELWGQAAEAALELAAHVGEDVTAIIDSLAAGPNSGSGSILRPWRGRASKTGRAAPGGVDESALARELDGLVSSRLRPPLRRRAVVVGDLAALAVAVAESRTRLER